MNTQRPIDPPPAFTAGFSLIEVLVAIVVLSVGLLGFAALQLKGLQSAHAGYQRTLASVIASDAAERLWAEWPKGPVDAAVTENIEAAWLAAWQPDSSKPNQLTLPGVAASSITADAQGFLITVRWNEGRFANDAADPANAAEFTYRIGIPQALNP